MRVLNCLFALALLPAMCLSIDGSTDSTEKHTRGFGARIEKKIENVSIIALIAVPQQYDGKAIRTVGVLVGGVGFEQSLQLDFSKDRPGSDIKSRIDLKLSTDIERQGEALSDYVGHFVEVEGVFVNDYYKTRDPVVGIQSAMIVKYVRVCDRAFFKQISEKNREGEG